MTRREAEVAAQRQSARCALICHQFLNYCHRFPGRFGGLRRLVSVLHDCAEVCQLGANLIAHGIGVAAGTSLATADICDHCAQFCERLGRNRDDFLEELIQVCRDTSQAYRQLAGGGC